MSRSKTYAPDVRCAVCGSADVQVGMFVNPNTMAVDPEWLHEDQDYAVEHGYQWCAECCEHTRLVEQFADPERFAELESIERCPECGHALTVIDGKPVGCTNPECDACLRCIDCNAPLTDGGCCPNDHCPARP